VGQAGSTIGPTPFGLVPGGRGRWGGFEGGMQGWDGDGAGGRGREGDEDYIFYIIG
jgi:hypothetical protein